ncbi:hypothetical protein GY45DRAFT_327419 [Cubamyces sp. BRFM 1775]|nr:hypothetical protein GY45DRAFT_327419 [Cubamyces sp. BRFM 1775]
MILGRWHTPRVHTRSARPKRTWHCSSVTPPVCLVCRRRVRRSVDAHAQRSVGGCVQILRRCKKPCAAYDGDDQPGVVGVCLWWLVRQRYGGLATPSAHANANACLKGPS